MSYRLRTGEGIAVGMRRIAREQLEGALCEIAAANSANEAAAVHAARKSIKKARALLRLIREEIGREIFKEENRSLRDVARGFSGPRDARVQLQLLEKLREQVPQGLAFEKTTAMLEEEIATQCRNLRPATPGSGGNLAADLRSARGLAAGQSWDGRSLLRVALFLPARPKILSTCLREKDAGEFSRLAPSGERFLVSNPPPLQSQPHRDV